MRTRGGFSLAEILLATGLVAILVLTVTALGLGALRSNQKSGDILAGQLVADKVLEEALYAAESNVGCALWGQNSRSFIYANGAVQVGPTSFQYKMYAYNITVPPDTAVTPPAPTAFKKVDVTVNWWDTQVRQGSGRLETSASRTIALP